MMKIGGLRCLYIQQFLVNRSQFVFKEYGGLTSFQTVCMYILLYIYVLVHIDIHTVYMHEYNMCTTSVCRCITYHGFRYSKGQLTPHSCHRFLY